MDLEPTLRSALLVDRDRLTNASRSEVARLCVLLFDRIQCHDNLEEQLLALAAAFLLTADALDIPAQDAFVCVKNMLADPLRADGMYHQFSAMKEMLADHGFKTVASA